ncbi:MAG TPA: ferrous iron transport protein B [Aquifex aeolicus]|nr:ferrous iron transport protein B [Aquifex aeolicus]
MNKTIKVGVAGSPNVGKTTILNRIAGTKLKVGNWPGVTVEKREAVLTFGEYKIHLIDLPGVYTLEPISEDERIAVEFLEREEPDVILNVIETPNLERNLILTAELLEFGKPTVIVLNMMDEAEKLGMDVDSRRMEELLGTPVVKTVGRSGVGTEDILPAIVKAYEKNILPKPITYSEELEKVIREIGKALGSGTTKRSLIKALLEEERFSHLRNELESFYGRKAYEIVSDERYAFAHGLFAEVVKKDNVSSRDITASIDRIALHPFLGFVVFACIIYLVFKLSFDLSSPFVDWVDGFIGGFAAQLAYAALSYFGFPEWFQSFFSEAVVGGVGFVLTFVPLIGALYFFITLLEMSGYIPRVAFLMDRFMHRLGLHGKSVIPLILGFGCNVPAILATRTIESVRDKLIVMMMIPFMSCPARLVVFAFFASIFFRENPALLITFLYILGVVVALLTAFLLRKTLYRGALSHFVMELPPYRFPSMRTVFSIVWAHVRDFLYRAGTLIFGASILIWLLLNLPPGVSNPSQSVAGAIGRALVPVFEPIGIDNWRATTSLIPAFLAREIVIGSMGTIYATEKDLPEEREGFELSEALKEQVIAFGTAVRDAFLSVLSIGIKSLEVEDEGDDTLRSLIRQDFGPASALSFMVFLLIYTSCLGTFGVMVREIGKLRASLFLVYSFVIAWLVSFLTYRVSGLYFNWLGGS